jgi:hypothetical protein
MEETMRTFFALACLFGCGSDDAAKFVGRWTWAPGAAAQVTCGAMTFDNPLAGVVETFTESGDTLSKTDSQGCAGLKFTASGSVASLSGAGQSCTIPAAGMSPSATFAPSAYTFAISADGKTLTAAISASYTPSGGSACAVSAANQTLARQ